MIPRLGWSRLVMLLVALPVLGLLVALVVGLSQPAAYRATATVFVASASPTNVADVAEAPPFVEQARSSYADVVTTPLVLDQVIRRLGLRETRAAFLQRIEVATPQDRSTIAVSVTAPSAAAAAHQADALVGALAGGAPQLAPAAGGAPRIHLTVLGSAAVPASPDRSALLRALLIGGGAGLVAALLVLAVLTVRRPPAGGTDIAAPTLF